MKIKAFELDSTIDRTVFDEMLFMSAKLFKCFFYSKCFAAKRGYSVAKHSQKSKRMSKLYETHHLKSNDIRDKNTDDVTAHSFKKIYFRVFFMSLFVCVCVMHLNDIMGEISIIQTQNTHVLPRDVKKTSHIEWKRKKKNKNIEGWGDSCTPEEIHRHTNTDQVKERQSNNKTNIANKQCGSEKRTWSNSFGCYFNRS